VSIVMQTSSANNDNVESRLHQILLLVAVIKVDAGSTRTVRLLKLGDFI
jgi:hypothetical protein